ncbi:MAG: DUF418 domain-containing protein [Pseudomonadota bacterium]
MATAAPTGARYLELDALRGFAVMGILAMNIVGFAMPGQSYLNPGVYGDAGPADVSAWIFNFILVDGKMRGLFSLLFGASMMLIIQSAEAKGQSPAQIHYARMFWLALFGLAHFYLLWFGDILFLYAVIGCLAFLFRNMDAKRLIRWGLIIFTFGTLLWALIMAPMLVFQAFSTGPGADPEMAQNYQQMMDDLDVQGEIARDLAAYRGSYVDTVQHKLTNYAFQPLVMIFQVGLETLPMMLFGMAMLKNGFLLGQWSSTDYNRWGWRLTIGGAILSALIAWIQIACDFDVVTVMNAAIAWTYIPRLMMTIGYAALLLLVIQRFGGTAFIRRVASAGRAAFTNYLGTSIIMCAIFYGWGFGLFGSVGRWELYLFVLGMWALMLLWSQPWLIRFRYGPLEWLWRSLARGKLQRLTIR